MTNGTIIDRTGIAGGLTGWRGRGELTRVRLLGVLRRAGLPADLAPPVKSKRRILGDVLSTIRYGGLIKTQQTTPRKDGGGNRPYAVRWGLAETDSETEVGGSVGHLQVVVELRDDSDDVFFSVDPGVSPGLASLVGRIREEYERLRDDAVYTAAQVTTWLSDVIRFRFNGVYYSTGYFIPQSSLDAVSKLTSELSRVWGENWTDPAVVNGHETGGRGYLPLTSDAALSRGIVAGLDTEIEEIEEALDREAERRRSSGHDDVSATAAVRFLKAIQAVAERARSYSDVCGDIAAPLVSRLGRLDERLRGIATDCDIRVAFVEIDDFSEAEPREDVCARVARGADAALERRRAMHADRTAATAVPTPVIERPIELM